MKRIDAREALRATFSEAGLSPALAETVLAACRLEHLPAGRSLQRVGDGPGGVWGLARGALAVEVAPGTRDPHKSFLLHPPAWVGEGTLLGQGGRLASLTATRESALLHLSLARFREIERAEPLLWRWVYLLQRRNFARAMAMADALMTRDSAARVARVLLLLAGDDPGAATGRELDLTQAELAAIANVSRSVLNPILQDLERRGALELRRGIVTIADAGGLRARGA